MPSSINLENQSPEFVKSYLDTTSILEKPTSDFQVGKKVSWKWSKGKAVGVIDKIYFQPITLKIKDVTITRNASRDRPIIEISHSNQHRTLKMLKFIDEVELEQEQEQEPKVLIDSVVFCKDAENSIIRVGSIVSWKYGQGKAKGRVKQIYKKPIEITTKGVKIKRNGSPENPALLIEVEETKTRVLRLASEVSKDSDKNDFITSITETTSKNTISDVNSNADTKVDLTPTKSMIVAAARGLKYVEQGFGGSGLMAATIAYARKVVNGGKLSPDKVKRMKSFIARHSVDKRPGWDNPTKPSPGFVAMLLWFNDPRTNNGAKWAERKLNELEKAS